MFLINSQVYNLAIQNISQKKKIQFVQKQIEPSMLAQIDKQTGIE